MNKIVERLKNEYDAYESAKKKDSPQEIIADAYKITCYKEFVNTAEEYIAQFSEKTKKQLEVYDDDKMLLEFLYDLWLKGDNNFAKDMWADVNYRLENSCEKMAGF